MEFISDLHVHGKHAAACSKHTTIPLLEKYARMKGLDLLGTGDFQHPLWQKHILEELTEDENGILWTKSKFPFLWQTEISLIYTQDGKGRRAHHLIFAPNGEVAKQITEFLGSKGRLDYDGRPIFGFNSVELVDFMRDISDKIEIIPAHVWTSHFSVMGEYNQHSKVEDCFKNNTKYIHALETGMSSDPADNRRLSVLDKFNLVSFSDSHSAWPWRLGREATIFEFDKLAFDSFLRAIREGVGLKSTVETYTSYGKYHFTGHRNCGVSFSPKESKDLNKICPKCSAKLTIGVADRIELLADRPEGFKRDNAVPFVSLIPLHELISAVYDIKQLQSKRVWETYTKLVTEFKSEFNVLLNVSYEDLCKVIQDKLARVIVNNREDKLKIEAGFDGVYGKIMLDKEEKVVDQKKLGDFK